MKRKQKIISILLVLSFLLTTVCVFPIGASSQGEAGVTQKKIQKVVTVVYDDSTSMKNPILKGSDVSRADYALYAMKMLMALLGEGDVLQIVPMDIDKNPKAYTLVGNGRQGQINDIVSSGIFRPSGGTPITSVDTALLQLEGSGLKDAQNLATQDENKEFWLFVLTDGEFSGVGSGNKQDNTARALNERINKYPTLKTIYFAFSNSAIDLRGTSFETELSTAYKAGDGNELVKGMQDIASQLSGRYNYSDFSVDNDTVRINLGSCRFPIKNLSVLALNSGATVSSVKYQAEGAAAASEIPSNSIMQSCIIEADNIPEIKPGYSAIINGDPYFSKGTLTIKFSAPISKEYISIFAEPALVLSPTFKVDDGSGNLTSVDTDYITGGKVSTGQKLMVGYKCTSADGTEIDIGAAFNSSVKATVTYAGTAKAIPDGSTETDIVLVEGPNSIAITVNVEGVNYKMYTSINCNILADQSSYNVVAEHQDEEFTKLGSSVASYKVFVNNTEKTPAQLKNDGFTWYVEITSPDGSVQRIDNPEINGRIACEINSKNGAPGNYKVYFRVVSTLGWRMDEAQYSYSIDIDEVEVRCDTPETPSGNAPRDNVDFTVLNGGLKLDKKALASYDVKLKTVSYDGTEKEITPEIAEDGTITGIVEFVPGIYGEYTTFITVKLKGGDVEKNLSHTFKIYPSSVLITGEHPEAFENGNTVANAKYRIKLDGKQLSKEQLDKYNWTLKTYAPGGVNEYSGDVTVEPDGTVCLEYDVEGAQYGAYESVLEIAFSDDYKETYKHSIKNYPTDVVLNVVGSQSLSITQHQMTENDRAFRFELLSNGMPLVFNNGITTCKVLLDGKDITQYATMDGNVLTYAPHADQFNTTPQLGEYTVNVSVESTQTGTVSASTSFEVVRTVYEIRSLPDTNKKIERFRLKDISTSLSFQILRDGVPLPLDELKAAYEAGEISVKDRKGTFTWEFWFPCGREIGVKEIDGQSVLEFKITRDIRGFGLDKALAMFFLTGDKPVDVSYLGASVTDAITVERGEIWIYLLIWFIIFLIIHIILFIVGFFNGKCKNLPTGVVVTISLMGGKEQRPRRERIINRTFMDRWKWHLGRLFWYGCFKNKKLWYHQPPASIPFRGKLYYMKDGRLKMSFRASGIFSVTLNAGPVDASRCWNEYMSAFKSGNRIPNTSADVDKWMSFFKKEGVEKKPTDALSPTGIYGEISKTTQLLKKTMIFVVER